MKKFDSYLKGFYYTSLLIVRTDKKKGISEYTFDEVSDITKLAISYIKCKSRYQYENDIFRKTDPLHIDIKSVESYLIKKHNKELEVQYKMYRDNAIKYGYFPNGFEDFLEGKLETRENISDKYIYYKDAYELLEISDLYYNKQKLKHIRIHSPQYPEILNLNDVWKFKEKDRPENLKYCPACKQNLNYLSYRVFKNEKCDVCTKQEEKLILKQRKAVVKNRRKKSKKKSKNLKKLAKSERYYTFANLGKKTGLSIATIRQYAGIYFDSPYPNLAARESADKFIESRKDHSYHTYIKEKISNGYMPVSISDYRKGKSFTDKKIPKEYCSYGAAAKCLKVGEQTVKKNVMTGGLKTHPEFSDFLIIKKNLVAFTKRKKFMAFKNNFRKTRKQYLQRYLKHKYSHIEKYGTSSAELRLVFLKTDQKETQKLLDITAWILKHRKTPYVKILQEKVLLRMERIKEMNNTDFDMSITGYKFDF